MWSIRMVTPSPRDKTTDGLIDTITVAGAITTETRLVGTVYPAPGSSGQVFFQNLIVTPTGELGKIDEGQVSNFRTVQNGIKAIDMPQFLHGSYGNDQAEHGVAHPHHGHVGRRRSIFLRESSRCALGALTWTLLPLEARRSTRLARCNEFQINLGLPLIGGTSVIVNTVNSDAEANSTAGSAPFQDYATFLVTGRLNLFQANEIDGNTTSGLVPTQLVNSPSSSGASPGGTFLISQGGPATGQIGDVRIGGNVTNFTTFVTEDPMNAAAAEGQLDAKISNFYIGGETNNVLLVAPSGSRNISFGLGHG